MNALRPARPPRRPGPRAGRTVVHGAESRAAPRPSLRVFGFLRLHLVLAAARHAGALAALRGSPGRDRSGFWAAWRTQGPSRRPRRSLQAVPNWPRGRFALTQHHPPRCTDRGQPPTLNLLCESPRRTAVRAFFFRIGYPFRTGANRRQPVTQRAKSKRRVRRRLTPRLRTLAGRALERRLRLIPFGFIRGRPESGPARGFRPAFSGREESRKRTLLAAGVEKPCRRSPKRRTGGSLHRKEEPHLLLLLLLLLT